MADQDTPPIATATTGSDTGTVPVTDRRPVPQGLLPRRFQTWLLAGLAFGILVIIMLAGEPPAMRACLIRRTGNGFQRTALFETAADFLRGAEPASRFVF